MRVGPLLLIAFIVTPLIEIGLFLVVGGRIGVVATLVIIVVTAMIGASLVSRQGQGEVSKAQTALLHGTMPTRELAHGAMILFAGALLLTPGFLTDAVGFSLLVPAVRERLRRWASRRFGSGPITIEPPPGT